MTREEAIKLLSMIEFDQAECNLGTWYATIDEDMRTALDMAISALSENKCFEGMTNGEVINIMFPNADYEAGKQFMHITNVNSIGEICFPWQFWNAPYKAESEDKE